MSLNDIELPDPVLAALYGDSSLIRPSSATTPSFSAPPPSPPVGAYKFLGNNQKKITILVESAETAFLPDDQLAFLTKMLEACKMNIGDVAIVNQAASRVDISGLKRLSPQKLLLFGPAPADIGLPINFPLFKIQPYDQCNFLWVPSLAQLVLPGEESKLLKTKLWVCLRQLFEV
jgi:hypothetical protein